MPDRGGLRSALGSRRQTGQLTERRLSPARRPKARRRAADAPPPASPHQQPPVEAPEAPPSAPPSSRQLSARRKQAPISLRQSRRIVARADFRARIAAAEEAAAADRRYIRVPYPPHPDRYLRDPRSARSRSAALPLLPPSTDPAYTVVFDLDETIVARKGPADVIVRRHARDLFGALRGRCELVLWTAAGSQSCGLALEAVESEGKVFDHVIYKNDAWMPGKSTTAKDLTLLGRSLDRTVLVENSFEVVQRQPGNAVVLRDLDVLDGGEDAFAVLLALLDELISSGAPVRRFLSSTRHVHHDAGFQCLRSAAGPAKVPPDLAPL